LRKSTDAVDGIHTQALEHFWDRGSALVDPCPKALAGMPAGGGRNSGISSIVRPGGQTNLKVMSEAYDPAPRSCAHFRLVAKTIVLNQFGSDIFPLVFVVIEAASRFQVGFPKRQSLKATTRCLLPRGAPGSCYRAIVVAMQCWMRRSSLICFSPEGWPD